MVTRRVPFRFALTLLALLQLAAPTVAVAADAAATAGSRAAHAHVESTTDASCARVHDAECVFCQLLATGAMSPSPADVPAPILSAREAVAFALATPDTDPTRGAALPRAPPIA